MKKFAWLLLMLAFVLSWGQALAQEEVYTLQTEDGQLITHYHGECEEGDEYFSGDNRHYRIVSVDTETLTAIAEDLGDAEMPDISWLTLSDSMPVSAIGQRKIALYCTHSDESYIEGDGTESVEGKGGIYDIADAFGEKLESLGASVTISAETHLPHDAGAYRRSRQTAMSLLKTQPNAIFDLHRDGIPDPEEYAVTIGDKKMSKVRLLVGKSNQNKEANLSFAKQIKAVGDKTYPGLIKDIYMGKGTYNQDLAPRSVLLEFGTHTLSKERVNNSIGPMSEVVYKALFGGLTGSAGGSDARGRSADGSSDDEMVPASESNEGSGAAIWLIVALIVGLGVFAFLSAGKAGGIEKWKRNLSEMSGGLFGKRPKDKE